LEEDKMNKRWPKTHKLLPKYIQKSVEETLCVSKILNFPKELTWVIITLMITITQGYESGRRILTNTINMGFN